MSELDIQVIEEATTPQELLAQASMMVDEMERDGDEAIMVQYTAAEMKWILEALKARFGLN